MSEITDAERLQVCLRMLNAKADLKYPVTVAEIDAAILAERKPVVERSTWQAAFPNAVGVIERHKDTDARWGEVTPIGFLRRDFWSNGDVTCELEGL